ncbi:MAG TPA: hypothetical protein VKG01_14890 [Thermoanaerobaculia bacterium]|nr:hypothetical protein [Thermoanaerobaculia bacterium]
MRKMWKTAAAVVFALIGWEAAAHAQPLIAGNTSSFGCGPISTSDYTLGAVVQSFTPTGAGTSCPTAPVTNNNGRGLAIGGQEVFYTELVDSSSIPGPPGFGPTDLIRVAPFNSGAGGADTRSLPNPRPGSGIQDLTFNNGTLFALTGYETDPPWVYSLNLSTGAVLTGPIALAGSTNPVIALPAGTDSDGFAVLPNGHFLINNGDTSCIYNEYDNVTGKLVPSGTINVPGSPGLCTGVDTDGTSLYFFTDFENITQTDLSGNMTGFSYFDLGGDHQIEDISLVHPVTIITDVQPAGLYFTISNTDDINTKFDLQAELLLNDVVIGSGIKRCVDTAGVPGTFIPRNWPGLGASIPVNLPTDTLLVSGDVLSLRVSARLGTDSTGTASCGGHVSAVGLRFFYDAVGSPSQIALTISPDPSQTLYLHSNGTTCTNALGESSGVTARTLSNVAPTATSPRCKEVGSMSWVSGNAWQYFSTWYLAAIP